jgi:prolyl oligopeptidase
MSYSPLHQIKKGTIYPSSLIITGDNDDRVPPFQSYKFLAALQKNQTDISHSYILYQIDRAGHQLSEQFDERTYQKAYIRTFINKHLFPEK